MASLNKAMEDMLVAKAESYISTYYKKFKRTLSTKSDLQTIVYEELRWYDSVCTTLILFTFVSTTQKLLIYGHDRAQPAVADLRGA